MTPTKKSLYLNDMKLLTTGNAKTVKGEKRGFLTFILHLAPHQLSGYNVCPMATEGCRSSCLNTAGRGGMFPGHTTKHLTGVEQLDMIKSGDLQNRIQAARIRKTRMFFEDRDTFIHLLMVDIHKAASIAHQRLMTPVFRLNGTSDIRWETLTDSPIRYFSELQFYDYTKISNRRNIPSNYHLTFSLAENNDEQAHEALTNGMNVAVVFRQKPFPETFMNRPVVDGDENDLRFLDPKGVIVGLRAKGKARNDNSGFVRNHA